MQTRITEAWSQLQTQRQSIAFFAALILAYGFDYLFNIVSGRLLGPAEFGALVAVIGVGQILVVFSRVIQTVTTRYVADYAARNEHEALANFVHSAFRLSLFAATILTILALPLAPPLARFLGLQTAAPLYALVGLLWLLIVRPIVDGTFQGKQDFSPLGTIQIIQAGFRLIIGIALIMAGLNAFGAIVALPIASFIALLYGWHHLRKLPATGTLPLRSLLTPELIRYFTYTTAGLIGFAVLVNLDAILVKRYFDSQTAGLYGPVVTLGKIVQFVPIIVITILFPKASERKATNRDPAEVLKPALLLVSLFCASLTALYFLLPNQLIGLLFGDAYLLPGPVLGLIGLAMWFISIMNVWLNYFLSIDETTFVYVIWIGVIGQLSAFSIWHDHLWQIPFTMALTGLTLSIIGTLLFVWKRRSRE